MLLPLSLFILLISIIEHLSHATDAFDKSSSTNVRTSAALLALNATLYEDERRHLNMIIHRTYKVQDHAEIREDLRQNTPRFYSIVADLESLVKKFFESKFKITSRRLENYAIHSPRDLTPGAARFADLLKEHLLLVDQVIRKEILFKFMQAANTIQVEEINGIRKRIGDRFRFNTVGEIFGDFERSVPELHETLLNVSETLAVGVGSLDPGTPEKYNTETTLGEHELDVLAETFASSNAEIAIILCTCMVQTINRMSDEEILNVRAIPREDIVLSATRWPFSLGVLNHTEIVRFALKFNSTIAVVLDKRIKETKRIIEIEFDEDQQMEFIERIDILNERVQRFLVQFAVISLVETIQFLSEYDVSLVHRYVGRKIQYKNMQDIEKELSTSAPNLFAMALLLMSDIEDIFKDRLRFSLDAIDRSWSLSTNDSLAVEIEADLAPETFVDMAKSYGAFATTIMTYVKEQVFRAALRLANENWMTERIEINRIIHTMTTRYHRTLLRYMRRETPTVYKIIGPFHLLMEGKKKSAKDPALAVLLEILRAESVRVFNAKLTGGRLRDKFGEEAETFYGRHFNAYAMVRGLTPEQLVLLTKSFKRLTPEQRQIFDNVAVF